MVDARGQELGVDPAYTPPQQPSLFDQGQHGGVGGGFDLRKRFEQLQEGGAVPERAQGQFSPYPRVGEHLVVFQQSDQRAPPPIRIVATETVRWHRGLNLRRQSGDQAFACFPGDERLQPLADQVADPNDT